MSTVVMSPTSYGRSRARSVRQARPESVRAASRLRLTVRGRRVLVLGIVLLLAGLVVAGRAMASDGGHPLQVETYTVMPGDTLWEIATAIKGRGEDVRDVILELENLNRLTTADLAAGTQILLPVDK